MPEKISLISRDEKSVLVVTYSDLKRCFENTFQELIAAANGQLSYLLKKKKKKKKVGYGQGAQPIANCTTAELSSSHLMSGSTQKMSRAACTWVRCTVT